MLASTALLTFGIACHLGASAQSLPLAQAPMLTLKSAPGLVMLTMGRDLPLYKAAYNDVNDLDDDGVPDLYFKPGFKYEGYFAYDRCYLYSTANNRFEPDSMPAPTVVDANDISKNYYKCPGKWSGNFLNWVSMARIDVLRKVLYGGKRSTDTATTVLERTFVPQDSTMWGKEYRSEANDGYNIADFTPLALPTGTNRHMFANTTLQKANTADRSARYTTTVNNPLMIVYENRSGRIWDLVAQEMPILGSNPLTANMAAITNDPQPAATRGNPVTQYVVRVTTCVAISGKYESWCTGYPASAPTAYKPTGLLHKYGEAKTLAFGLISGTYDNNYAGGVLRQNIDDFNQEVLPSTGRYNTGIKGIVYHLNAFRPWGFGGYDWGSNSFSSLSTNGQFPSWGNPLGEMMFEGLKYFSAGAPTAAFTSNVGTAANSPEPATKLNLQTPAWSNPYAISATRANTQAYPKCARPIQMTIGDPKTSFDSDHLPGAAFSVGTGMGTNSTGTLDSLNVSTEADAIWLSEFSGSTKNFFIGEAPGNADGNPSSKVVNSFKNIRGHGPDATTNQGSFYGASVARYGKFTGVLNPAIGATPLRVDQVSIALDSHIPQIKIPLNGKTVSIVLLSKSVDQLGISNAKGSYQQTGSITAFFVDQMANTNANNMNPAINGGRPYYKFRISFSDTDQGNDNESDAKVTYEIKVTGATTLSIGMDYFNGSNGIEMHQGYVISGTTTDGVYLDTAGGPGFGVPPAPNKGYYLDTMPGRPPGSAMTDTKLVAGVLKTPTGPDYTDILNRLPLSTLAAPRSFTVGTSTNGEFVPHDMLWYAAKYGSATGNYSGNGTFKLRANGDPENYYLANNPSTLAAKMGEAFQKAASLAVATGSAVASNGTKVSGGSLVYQAGFDSEKWGGELRAFTVQADGNIGSTPVWLATAQQPAPASRTLVLGQGGTAKVTITPTSYAGLTTAEKAAFKDDATLKYLIGTRTGEKNNGGALRDRSSAIGDIVNSDPLYIGKADFGYTDTDYATFKAASDPQLVGVGSNDGIYRLISAPTGVEQLAFIPKSATTDISKLSDPSYTHQYYIDGPSGYGHAKFSTTGNWNGVLVASLGAGGKAIFALNASATNLESNGVLWELAGGTSGVSQYLGNVVNKPIIGQMSNDVGAVFVGNGANSNDDQASLLILNAATGASIRTCIVPGNIPGNGMTSIAAVSTQNNGKIDLIYGADYKGNIWRMLPDQGNCGTSGPVKVFTAKNSSGVVQPITGELTVIKAPNSKPGYMILFGTGKYSGSTDPSNSAVQSLYGVWDDDSSATTGWLRSNLVAYPISGYSASNLTRSVATVDNASINGGKAWYEGATFKAGWVVDLTCTGCPVGERFVDKATLVGPATSQIAYFLTIVPSADVCQVGGGGWVTGIDPNTGAYVKAFASVTPNSAYVGGVTPRGLFIVTKDGTTSAPGKEYLYVTRNYSTGSSNTADAAVSPAFNQVSGGTTNGADGSGTTSLGTEVPCPTCSSLPNPATGTRRQVWRQIQ